MSKNKITLLRKGQSRELGAKIRTEYSEAWELQGGSGREEEEEALLQFGDQDLFSRKDVKRHEVLRLHKIPVVCIE